LSEKCYAGQGILDGQEAEERTGAAGAVVCLIITVSYYEFVYKATSLEGLMLHLICKALLTTQ
jgi:hypothetical protein